MPVFGHFQSYYNRRPIVTATVVHPTLRTRIPLDFMVDTGADRTLLIPEHQELLKISRKHLVPVPQPIYTLAGPVECDALPDCTMVLTGSDDRPIKIDHLTVYFLRRRKGRRQLPTEEGALPSIMGRDVLDRLALSYCFPSKQLLLTDEISQYPDLVLEESATPILKGATLDAFQSELANLNKEIAALHERAQVTLKALGQTGGE